MISRSLRGLPLFLLVVCSTGTEPGISLWQGTLRPVAPSTITGPVAAVAQGGRTHVSIEIRMAVAGQTYAWHLDEGTCPLGGPIQGGGALYSPLTADAARTAKAEAAIPGQMSPGKRYAVPVLGTGVAANVLAACADLAETSSESAG